MFHRQDIGNHQPLSKTARAGSIGSFSGNTGLGALLGAGVGGGGGYLYDQSQRSQQPYYADQRRSRTGYNTY